MAGTLPWLWFFLSFWGDGVYGDPSLEWQVGVCADGATQAGLAAAIEKFHQMQMSESTRLAEWKHVNSTSETFEYIFRDTACNDTLAQEVGIELMAASQAVDVMLGCTCDTTTDATARIGAIMKVPQISFTAGALVFSADKSFYTYFMRTLPPLRGVPKYLVRLLNHFQWTTAKFVALSDERPNSDLIEEDMFYQTAELAEGQGIALTRIELDLAALNSTEPTNGMCAAPLELSADGERCQDLTKWREALHNGRVLPELIHIACIYDPAALVALRLAAEEGITKHVWIFDGLDSILESQSQLGKAPPVSATTLAALEGSLNLEALVTQTEVWERYRDFVPVQYGSCVDSPMNWVDGSGDANNDCSTYVGASWCAADGGPGSGWNFAWGDLDDWANDGISAVGACCGCGGGTIPMTPIENVSTYNEMELVDALMTIWMAVETMKEDGKSNWAIYGEELHKAMMNVSFLGTRGQVTYDQLGDIRLEGEALELFNRQGGQWVGVGRIDMPSGVQLRPNREIVWAGGSTEVPDGTRPECERESGEYYDGLDCIPCGPGQGLAGMLPTDGFGSFCQPCTNGQYSTSGVCLQCFPGQWSWQGATECEPCERGYFRRPGDEDGCARCDKGSFSNESGVSACQACPRGRYADKKKMLACEECPAQAGGLPAMTTAASGGQSLSDCVCFAGTFHPCEGEACRLDEATPDAGFCQPCPAGMTCSGNRLTPNAMFDKGANGVPIHKAPYWPSGVMAVGQTAYYCGPDADGKSCLGAKMGSNMSTMCAPFSSGVACAECDEAYAYQDGECVLCSSRGMIGFSILVVLGSIFLLALFILSFPREPHGTLTEITFEGAMHRDVFSNTLAAGLNLLQTTWLFAKAASIQWPASTRALFTSTGDGWDLSIFNLECQFDGNPRGFAVNRTILLNALPAFPLAVLVISYTMGKIGRNTAEAKGWAHFPDPCQACSMGLSILSVCFLVIANSAINCGFAEFEHPGGQRSLVYFPYLLTTDSEVSTIRVVSLVGIVSWCAGATTWVIVLLVRMPARIHDIRFRRSTLSITSRFRPKYPWWFLMQLLLNLLIAMSPSLFMSGEGQLGWMSVVFTVYLAMVASFRPYFCPVTYYCDCTCTFGKLVILLLVVPFQCGEDKDIAVLINLISGMVYMIALGEIVYALALWAQFNLRGKKHNLEEEWHDLGGRLTSIFKFPYTSSMVDLMELVRKARPSLGF